MLTILLFTVNFLLDIIGINSEDVRTANIIADDPEGVSCLVIDRHSFNQFISGLDEIRTKYVDNANISRK